MSTNLRRSWRGLGMPRHVDIEELPAVDPQILAKLAKVTTPANAAAFRAMLDCPGSQIPDTIRVNAHRARRDAQRHGLHVPPWHALRIALRNGTMQDTA